jgi:DNA (cytosine-5)-methyltransferase 1
MPEVRSRVPALDYPALLSAAWAEHLAPRADGAPTFVSTFAGVGGSSLGYSMAGFRELLAVEWDARAAATFRLNFPSVPVYEGDIARLTVKEILRLTGLRPGDLDLLDGSPPCQGFSTAGEREIEDPRNQLFRDYCRLLKGLRPKGFVMENVSGMVKGKMRLIFADILRELKACGYDVKAWLLNSMYFQVPQNRQRMVFIGTRLEWPPTCPKATSRPVTVRQAIGHLPLGVRGNHQPQVINAWHRSKPGQSLRKAVKHVGSFQSVRLDPDAPSTTQIKSVVNWHYALPRKLTREEAALLGSFPVEFQWAGAKAHAHQGIGNSVPPLFMRAIASHVRREVLRA